MAHTKHVTLVATTVATVTLDDPSRDKVWVTNRSATEAFATVDGTAPTVGGDDTALIPANATKALYVPAGAVVTLKLISTGTPTITATIRPPVAV